MIGDNAMQCAPLLQRRDWQTKSGGVRSNLGESGQFKGLSILTSLSEVHRWRLTADWTPNSQTPTSDRDFASKDNTDKMLAVCVWCAFGVRLVRILDLVMRTSAVSLPYVVKRIQLLAGHNHVAHSDRGHQRFGFPLRHTKRSAEVKNFSWQRKCHILYSRQNDRHK